MKPKFDDYAQNYDEVLNQNLAVTGESKEFFARARLEWLRGVLDRRGVKVSRVLDFGCGTGSATPYLLEILGARSVVGVDVSAGSLETSRQTWGHLPARFLLPGEAREEEGFENGFDLAFCNGVFHHIAPALRAEAVGFCWRALKSGGLFSLWENNPWNPATRYVMGRCPFDDDAITMTPPQARRLLNGNGFSVGRTDFLFLFPRALAALRPLEARLARWPLGAQYGVLSSKG